MATGHYTILEIAKLRRSLLSMQSEMEERMAANKMTPEELWVHQDDMKRLARVIRKAAGRPVKVYQHINFPYLVKYELTREEV